MKQNSFDPAKDGGAGADSQGQANDGKERKSGIAPQHSKTETNILTKLVRPDPNALLARPFLELLDSAEFTLGSSARFHGRHAGGDFAFHQ